MFLSQFLILFCVRSYIFECQHDGNKLSFQGHTWSGDLDPFSRSEEFEMRWKLVSYQFHVFIVAKLNTWCAPCWLWFSRMTWWSFSDIMSKLSAHCTLCWFWFSRMTWWSFCDVVTNLNTFCTPCWFWFPTTTWWSFSDVTTLNACCTPCWFRFSRMTWWILCDVT